MPPDPVVARCSFILTQGANAGEVCGWRASTLTSDGPRCRAHRLAEPLVAPAPSPLDRVRAVFDAHRYEPHTRENHYRLILDLQAILDPKPRP